MIGLGEIITTFGMMKSENGINCGFSLSINDTVKPGKLLWLSLLSFPHIAMLFTFGQPIQILFTVNLQIRHGRAIHLCKSRKQTFYSGNAMKAKPK